MKLYNMWQRMMMFGGVMVIGMFAAANVYATPTTLIWTPSTDIQPYGKIHINADTYTPVKRKDHNLSLIHI